MQVQRREDVAKLIETSKLPMKDIASMCGATLNTAYNVKQRISAGESIYTGVELGLKGASTEETGSHSL